MSIDQHLIGQELVAFQIFQNLGDRTAVRFGGGLRYRTGDKLYFVFRIAGLGNLDLIAGAFMTIVGGIRIRGILSYITARPGFDANLIFMNFALFIKNTLHNPVSVNPRIIRQLGKMTDQVIHVFGYLLPKQTAGFTIFAGVAKELMNTGDITLTQWFGHRLIIFWVTALYLGQKPFDGHSHHTRAAKTGHVTENMGGIQTLFVDFNPQQIDQFGGNITHYRFGQIILFKMIKVAFQGPYRNIMGHRFEIQGIMNVHAKTIGIQGLLFGPVLEFHDQQQSGHGVEFFSRPSHAGIKAARNGIDRHELENGMPKDARPAVEQTLAGFYGQDTVKRVKKPGLLWIYNFMHNRSKYLL